MKLAGKIFYIIWSVFVALTVCIYCYSSYIGYKIHEIAESAINSMGTDYQKHSEYIDENNFIKLWHEKTDSASFDRILIEEQNKTQKYSISNPQILFFQDKNSFFSFNKIGYIYNVHIYDMSGNETTVAAAENSKVILDIKYNGFNKFTVQNVFYDNDFDEYSVNSITNTLWLIIVILINAFIRNIRYFDRCILNKRKKNIFRFIQPYIFAILIIASAFLNMLPLALTIGIAEEIVFTAINFITDKK